MTYRHHLDARNLLCPLPVIRVQSRVKELTDGDLLEVSATDPGVLNDIPAWCRLNGHTIVESHHQDHAITILIEVHRATSAQ